MDKLDFNNTFVLPTEYDDSLSYYEVLCKLSEIINNIETGQVISVNGKSGVVVLKAIDVGARPDTWTPNASEVGAIPLSEKGANNGVATIDSEGYVVQPVRGGGGGTGGAVDSVNGQTGIVVLDAEDVGARPDDWTPTAAEVGARPVTWTPTASEVGAIPVSEKGANNGVATIDSEGYVVQPVRGGTGAVDSVNGKTGVVVLDADDVGAAKKSVIVFGNLLASSWVDGGYILSVSGVTETSNQEILPTIDITAEQLEALQAANIQDAGQGTAQILLKAFGSVPSIDIPIRIILRGDG